MARVPQPVGVLAAAALLLAGAAAGEAARPGEDALFGAPAASATSAVAAATGTREVAPENPLAIGGQLYLRETATARARQAPAAWSHAAPMLADTWLDARPDPRLRAQLVGRLSFDPTADASATTFLVPALAAGPSFALDQAWIKFDVGRTAFVTAGRQHVKWGVARFFNPNDLLHSTRRDALARFDARVGQTMLKLHVPWEKRGWNFYAIQLLESLDRADRVGRIGGAARAEAVLGPAEIGLDGLVQRGWRPRAGADFSSAVGPLDVYAEGTIQYRTDRPLWREAATQPWPGVTLLEPHTPDRVIGAMTGGMTWSFKIGDREAMTVGAEYFYNPAGYTRKKVYPWLMFQGEFAPFYVARDYAAVYGFVPVPGTNGNQTLTLSSLANLSDRSAVVRLDWTATAVTHLRVEAYAAGFLGAAGGEFRFGFRTDPTVINATAVPALDVPPPAVEAGVGLRLAF